MASQDYPVLDGTGATIIPAGRGERPNLKIKNRVQIVASRGFIPGVALSTVSYPGLYRSIQSRMNVFFGPSRVRDIQLLFGNFYAPTGGTDVASLNAIEFAAALEFTSPVVNKPFYFRGATSVNIAPGAKHVLSDPLSVWVEPYAKIYLRTGQQVSSVADAMLVAWSRSTHASCPGELAVGNNSDMTQVTGTGTLTGTSINGLAPMAVLGVPETPFVSVMFMGDSISYGQGDQAALAENGGIGFLARGLATGGVGGNSIPWASGCRSGELMASITSTSIEGRFGVFRYASHAIFGYGRNDVAAAPTLAAVQASMIAGWTAAKAAGCKVFQCTIVPSTTSASGNWTSDADQTVVAGFGDGGLRDQLNAWFLTQVGLGILDGVILSGQAVESPTDHTKWLSNGTNNYCTMDGVHPRSVGHALMAVRVKTAVQAFVV